MKALGKEGAVTTSPVPPPPSSQRSAVASSSSQPIHVSGLAREFKAALIKCSCLSTLPWWEVSEDLHPCTHSTLDAVSRYEPINLLGRYQIGSRIQDMCSLWWDTKECLSPCLSYSDPGTALTCILPPRLPSHCATPGTMLLRIGLQWLTLSWYVSGLVKGTAPSTYRYSPILFCFCFTFLTYTYTESASPCTRWCPLCFDLPSTLNLVQNNQYHSLN